jgi:hypothetical protein
MALAADLQGLLGNGDLPAAEVMRILPLVGRFGRPWVAVQTAEIALELAVAAPDEIRRNYAEWLKRTMGMKAITPGQAHSMEEFFREKQ